MLCRRCTNVVLAFVALALLALLFGDEMAARAQDYPNRFIRVIVGPGPDLVARLFGPKMSEALGQQVVIEPRPGAGGIIAAQTVATAQPDGYNLLLATASYTINTALRTTPYDMRKDFAPVARASTSPFILVVHPSVPAKTVGELIALAKSKPGQLNYASSGIGTPPHLAGELFKSMAGIDIVHVPFREANSALNAVVSGAVQMMFSISSTTTPQVTAGTVRGLGVTTLEPTPLVPGMPSISQSGLSGFEVTGWNGFVAPAGTPASIVGKLNAAVQLGLDDADVRKRLEAAGYEPAARNMPDEFARFIEVDTKRWVDIVEKANIQVK
ncbi:MAG: tripartite tricarboxylate transporter substrate binding protein [Xanthobacteraceae bacterium]|nr:tripartite tricarboxylate transporter substrate binding protein [Xanthobacteraceae bacterium]